jgi:hypothetical protein
MSIKISVKLANGIALIFSNIHLVRGQCADLSPYHSYQGTLTSKKPFNNYLAQMKYEQFF